MGTFGSSKVAKNTTNVDSRQQDNKVAATGSQVLSSAGGALNYLDSHGAITGGQGAVFNFGADTNALHQAVSDAAQNATAGNLAGQLASIAAQPPAAAVGGSHSALYVGAGVAAIVGLIVVVVLVNRR